MSDTLTGRHRMGEDEPEPATEASVEPVSDRTPAVPADDHPTEVMVSPAASLEEHVTCPECGTVAMVALTRRQAVDFCVQCDYPLFWAPSKIALDGSATAGESLRRLPGTAGRVTVGSIPCPHCSEGNLVGAQVCVRCGGLMDPPAPAPAIAAPPPLPEPEPPSRTPLWVWIVGASTLVMLAVLISYLVARG